MTATDPTTDGLLRAVLADPAEDVPRLVYADRLDELGQGERAEFVRVQAEIAREFPGHYDHPEYANESWHRRDVERNGDCPGCRLLDRSHDLWADHCDKWFAGPIHRHVRRAWSAARFDTYLTFWLGVTQPGEPRRPEDELQVIVRRGFVAAIELPMRAFVRHAVHLFRAHPIQTVRIPDVRPERVEGFELTRESGWTYFVGDANAGHTPHHVTNAIWRHMPRSWFETEADATAAFRTACLAWGREAAGQPTKEGD